MSNNNPHSHINQTAQNSWNPLQIPSYIPRQPQLAHMSNERPMVRSPLAWHAAAPPPDSLYNFMSAANHKNLEHPMNPLLPPYVRGPPPFDSMDLSLQSNRSAGSPLNKSAHSLLPALPPQLDYGHKLQAHQQQQQQQHNLQQQQTQMHAPSSYPIHNLSTNSPQSQQHSNSGMPNVSSASASSTPSSPAQNNAKFLSANGSDCEQPASLIQPAQNAQNMGTNNGNYMRENYGKMQHMNRAFENDPHSKSLQKPVELVNKDCNYSGMMSNKMPTSHLQQQQHTSKKHSPLRSGSSSGYHVSQAQAQQQQQQQSPFNSPATPVKHNGPHTPPTPQSPSMHQTQQQQPTNASNNASQQQQQQQQQHQAMLHGGNNNANLMNYNQLHLQQPQQHNAYQQSPHLQQQHLHHVYSPPQQPPPHHHAHHQHWQQQQQHQQHMSPHPPMPPQSPMQPPPFNSPLHPQQQTQQNTLTNLEPASPATPSYAQNTDSNFEQQRNVEQQHPTAATAAATHSPPPNRTPQTIPDSAESPTTNASSNDDDSNGDGSVGAGNKPPTPSKSKKGSNSNSPMSSKSSPHHSNKTLTADSPSKSPKVSAVVHHRKSPRKADIHSPESLDLSSKNIASPVSVITASPQRTLTPQRIVTTPTTAATPAAVPIAEDSTSQSANEAVEKLKNGHTPPVATHEIHDDQPDNDEVETIDKIAEMIAKTTSNSSSHHSNCSNSNDAHSNASSKSARTELCESPKTKKQRQALKLRNAEQSTHDWSTNFYGGAGAPGAVVGPPAAAKTTIPSPLVSNDDNAVLAEELRKPPPTTESPQLTTSTPQEKQPPLSPQSNSRSSSSSSSSSSCSNSTRSSFGKKSKEAQNAAVSEQQDSSAAKATTAPNDLVTPLVNESKVQQNANDVNESPLNLNCKANPNAVEVPKSIATPTSPDKSKFEEVENKLQEMFAGIEDEPILIEDDKPESEYAKTPASDQIATDLSVALELSNSLSDIPTVAVVEPPAALTQPATNEQPVVPPAPVPIQTKAAKKSTVPSPVKPATPPLETTHLEPSSKPSNSPKDTADAVIPPPKKMMPRRRLSMALDPANLRIMLEGNANESPKSKKTEQATSNNVVCILDDERPSTSAAAAAAVAALANGGNEDMNKQPKTCSNNTTNNSKGKSNANKSGSGKSSGSGAGGGGGKASTKTNAKRTKANQQKQTQQKRRKQQQSSSEDESPAASGRDANTSTAAAAANSVTEKYKSPFILIKRDGSVSVVNAATAEDSSSDKQTKGKKPPLIYANHERRNIRGFHSSTLSQKYDADTTDSTWICVFCKRGPHRMGLGDLFGPYLVSTNCEEYKNAINAPDARNIDEEFVNKRRRIDMVQSSVRGPPVVMATKAQEALTPGANRMNKKKKKSIDEPVIILDDPLEVANETFAGMNKVSENSFEVWLHEDCSVWAPDIYLVGARIMGLDAAVWNSIRYQCVICTKSGATVCCLQRDCKAAAHIPCARESLWSLNESDWHVHCQTHATKNNRLQNDNQQPQQTQQQNTTTNQSTKNS